MRYQHMNKKVFQILGITKTELAYVYNCVILGKISPNEERDKLTAKELICRAKLDSRGVFTMRLSYKYDSSSIVELELSDLDRYLNHR